MLFFRTTKILKPKKKNASTKLNSRSRKIKKSKKFFVFFIEQTRVGALKFFFFLFPRLRVCVALATRPKNLRAFVSSCEIFSRSRAHQQKFLVSLKFSRSCLRWKIPVPVAKFFLFTPFGTDVIFILPPHARVPARFCGG